MKYQSPGISGERTASPFFLLYLHDRLLLFSVILLSSVGADSMIY